MLRRRLRRKKNEVILMTFHSLVTRAPEYIPAWWTYSLIIALIGLALCGMLMGTSAISITHGFGENAIFKSKFVFKIRDPEMIDNKGAPLFPFYGDIVRRGAEGRSEDANKTDLRSENTTELARTKRHALNIADMKKRLKIMPRADDGVDDYGGYHEQDLVFLSTMTVDTHQSTWGPVALRDYIIFYPFVMEIVAIVWATILIAYRTGRENNWGLSKPWMIVVPSILVFSIMTLFTLAFWIVNIVVWNDLCENVRSQLVDQELDCILVIMAVQETSADAFHFPFSFYVYVFRHVPEISVILWAACLIIMIFRCLFMVDFQLINVAVKLIDVGSEKSAMQMPKDVEPSDKEVVVRFEEPGKQAKMLSQERISEDDFHSAHSTLTTFTTNENDHPSLEPLLQSGGGEEQSLV